MEKTAETSIRGHSTAVGCGSGLTNCIVVDDALSFRLCGHDLLWIGASPEQSLAVGSIRMSAGDMAVAIQHSQETNGGQMC